MYVHVLYLTSYALYLFSESVEAALLISGRNCKNTYRWDVLTAYEIGQEMGGN
jgi:hypothetical protein